MDQWDERLHSALRCKVVWRGTTPRAVWEGETAGRSEIALPASPGRALPIDTNLGNPCSKRRLPPPGRLATRRGAVVGDGPHSWSARGGQPRLAPTVGDAPRAGAWQTMIGSAGQPTAVAPVRARPPYCTGLRQRQQPYRTSRLAAVAGPSWSVAGRLVRQLAGVTTAEERDLSSEEGAPLRDAAPGRLMRGNSALLAALAATNTSAPIPCRRH